MRIALIGFSQRLNAILLVKDSGESFREPTGLRQLSSVCIKTKKGNVYAEGALRSPVFVRLGGPDRADDGKRRRGCQTVFLQSSAALPQLAAWSLLF